MPGQFRRNMAACIGVVEASCGYLSWSAGAACRHQATHERPAHVSTTRAAEVGVSPTGSKGRTAMKVSTSVAVYMAGSQ